jgi:hypothetical protein
MPYTEQQLADIGAVLQDPKATEDLRKVDPQALDAMLADPEVQALQRELTFEPGVTPAEEGLPSALAAMQYGSGLVHAGAYRGAKGLKLADVQKELDKPLREKEALALKLRGQFPGTSEYLAASGHPVPAGYEPVVDIAGGVLADPATYTPLIGGKIGKALNWATRPTGKLVEKGGEALYGSAFSKADAVLKESGKAPITPLLRNEGVWGTAKSVEEQALKIADKLEKRASKIVDETEAAGGIVSPTEITQGRPWDIAEETSKLKSSMARAEADKMLDELSEIEKLGEASPSIARKTKTYLYGKLGTRHFKEYNDSPVWQDFMASLANNWKQSVEDAATRTLGPGKGDELRQINDELGRLLTVRKTLSKSGAAEDAAQALTPFEATLLARASTGQPTAAISLAAGKAARLGRMTLPKTGLGLGIQKLGGGGGVVSSPIWPLMKHSLAESIKEE